MEPKIVIERYREEKKNEWNSFVDTAKNALFMFNRNYMDYHSDRFADHSLMFYRDGKLIALLPANEKDRELISHGGLTYGGFLFDSGMKQHTANDCAAELRTYAKEQGFHRIVYKAIPHMFHLQPAEEDRYALFQMGARETEMIAATVVNLKDPIKMPKGRKAQISRARREGVTVSILSSKEAYESFIDLENEVLLEHHNTKAVHTADELYLLHSRFPNRILLFGAVSEGAIIAGAVVFVYAYAIHTQYLAANERAREIGALDLTIMTVIEAFRDSKDWLDFGGSTENGGRYLNKGLISQKEGFGGRTNVYEKWELEV